MGLGLLPAATLLAVVDVAEGLALATQRCLGGGEALPESLTGDAQRILRVQLQAAG
jgi:hypothetical protein